MSKKSAKGVESDITDLVLRDGKQLAVELGAAILPTPTLTRDMEASSSLEVPVYDPNLALLEMSLLSEKFDATVDGLRFRYLGASKSGRHLTLSFEDQVIARLRELKGPKKAFRAKQTRANFICGLVEELKPEVPIYCPQRHEKQPIKKEEPSKSERESKKKEKEAEETPGGKGLGDTKNLNIEGVLLSPSQKELANTALTIANQVGAKFQVQVALIAALIDESGLGSTAPQNVLEAEQEVNGQGAPVGTAEEEISGFLTGKPKWTGEGAIAYYNAHPGATFYEIAQETQASGAGNPAEGAAFLGSNYAKFGDEAKQIVEAFGGATAGTIDTSEEVTQPYTFQVGKKETYWAAIQRLAKEVEWRAFVVEGRFFFISEPELSRGQVQMEIVRHPGEPTPENEGIIDVDFDFNANLPVTEATVTALAAHWAPRPGGVVTIAGYGPASLGAGDAPAEDGAKVGISSAVKASTHEGKGRYLVSRIESSLSGDPDAREITITLVKPTQPLPEKAATTRTISTGSTSDPSLAGAPEKLQAIIEKMDAIDQEATPYSWGGGHSPPWVIGGEEENGGPGYDCSGCVSAAVHAGGYLAAPVTSGVFATIFPKGEGNWMTIYGNAEHVVCKVKYPDGKWRGFATSGENPGGGAGWVSDGVIASEKAGKVASHPPGL